MLVGCFLVSPVPPAFCLLGGSTHRPQLGISWVKVTSLTPRLPPWVTEVSPLNKTLSPGEPASGETSPLPTEWPSYVKQVKRPWADAKDSECDTSVRDCPDAKSTWLDRMEMVLCNYDGVLMRRHLPSWPQVLFDQEPYSI